MLPRAADVALSGHTPPGYRPRHEAQLVDVLPTAEAGGFQPVHAAGAAVWGWSSNPSRFPAGSCVGVPAAPAGAAASRQAVTARPAARTFLAALTSACSVCEQWVQRNTAWLSRDFGSTCPHTEQRCDVNAAGTFTTSVPV